MRTSSLVQRTDLACEVETESFHPCLKVQLCVEECVPNLNVSMTTVFLKNQFFFLCDQVYLSLVLIHFITVKKLLPGNKNYF